MAELKVKIDDKEDAGFVRKLIENILGESPYVEYYFDVEIIEPALNKGTNISQESYDKLKEFVGGRFFDAELQTIDDVVAWFTRYCLNSGGFQRGD